MKTRSQYEWFVRPEAPGVLFVIDLDNGGRSVTNDIEQVCAELVTQGVLSPGHRLVYRDSENIWDEVLLDSACAFVRFLPLRATTPEEAMRHMKGER
jgi:hypothetical protein